MDDIRFDPSAVINSISKIPDAVMKIKVPIVSDIRESAERLFDNVSETLTSEVLTKVGQQFLDLLPSGLSVDNPVTGEKLSLVPNLKEQIQKLLADVNFDKLSIDNFNGVREKIDDLLEMLENVEFV